ncbi:hypothetical protein HN419_07850 [Candidatus Woesearchaeota archaeon]|jgi:uncharacterized protein|nr:hypothetical protein [Candidatus Woesearchaeota archaeon]MBT3538402.1 hypothetical protein [Candidatus Woesearchaeota archaeon]MBT4698363.1 hypothetical protein [Candidatus Woesearchaeota archaeon]MBT4716395.1 hypothetical protein [Candidatus Woesearchaeota archaeon]MBT7106071.1 hypothetical protein [Candidatus Woesearchaeota archaeon]
MTWQFDKCFKKTPELNKPILVEGLPGIGNVGKVVVDFIIDELKLKKMYDVFSYTFPHSVFVNEKNLVELPSIEMYYLKRDKGADLIFLTGDVQPQDEISSYEFCDAMLDVLEEYGGSEVITLGGIGLPAVSKTPKVYCTGNTKSVVEKYKKGTKLNDKLYGVVGPIVGVSGLLMGLAGRRKIPAISLLAETFAHPMYLGMAGAREIIKVLSKKLGIKVDVKKLEKEITELESEMLKKTKELEDVSKQTALKKVQGGDMGYIG